MSETKSEDDLIERLCNTNGIRWRDLMDEAADALAQCRAEVKRLKDELASCTWENNRKLTARVMELEGQVKRRDKAISEHQNEISILDARVAELEKQEALLEDADGDDVLPVLAKAYKRVAELEGAITGLLEVRCNCVESEHKQVTIARAALNEEKKP